MCQRRFQMGNTADPGRKQAAFMAQIGLTPESLLRSAHTHNRGKQGADLAHCVGPTDS